MYYTSLYSFTPNQQSIQQLILLHTQCLVGMCIQTNVPYTLTKPLLIDLSLLIYFLLTRVVQPNNKNNSLPLKSLSNGFLAIILSYL